MSAALAEWTAIQHVPFEGPGAIAREAARRGIALHPCRPYAGDALPDPAMLGGLVVMGGPMGVSDTAAHPWLADELELIRAVVQSGIPLLGVCLGAQLLAAALGAGVYPGPAAEIGPGSVTLTPEGRADPVLGAAGAAELPVVHWHGETFDLPIGALRLASSALYPNQAFRAGDCAYGLQFHVEVDRALAEGWREHLPQGVEIGGDQRRSVEACGREVIAAFFAYAGEHRA
ncbi:MAG TPA: gamma-glutamyl-gamma-aminobutyrate hydrolase family protein [Solirubrobacteraceae bacterium]|nr:gamma-glutamyl-gamma-aminobutyrate hydrolase family protein [Solirubrobacteraceae bacterium]